MQNRCCLEHLVLGGSGIAALPLPVATTQEQCVRDKGPLCLVACDTQIPARCTSAHIPALHFTPTGLAVVPQAPATVPVWLGQ